MLKGEKRREEENFNLSKAITIFMELSHSLNPNQDDGFHLSTPISTKRKVLQKSVVTVKIGSRKGGIGLGKMKNDGPPPDFWSWRKYGQKPIKGSPYPRGYYRCSTTKGCSAKKQVERCKTDGSMFIITYTSSHNHPGPNISTLNLDQPQQEIQPQPLDQDQDQDQNDDDDDEEEEKRIEKRNECLEEPISSSCSPTNKTELENYDLFFDELEELPIPPSLSGSYFDELKIISAAPS